MIDYSFLRFKRTLAEAQDIGNPRVSELNTSYQVHLKPFEAYVQITNTDFGITLAGDYVVLLVDDCGYTIADITETVVFQDFLDIKGVNQMAVSFVIKDDFGFEPLHIKIKHLYSFSEYYSAPFICTDSLIEQTSLFTYKSFGYFEGISYDKFENYQQIRLNLWFDNVENQSDVNEYYQVTTQNTISARALYKQSELYQSTYMNRFTFERVNIMLIHDVVYVDGVRITNKPQLTSEERLLGSNMIPASVSVFKDYNDKESYTPSAFEMLLIEFRPIGLYINSSPIGIEMTFNNLVIDNGNSILEMRSHSDDSLIFTRTSDDFTIVGNKIKTFVGAVFRNDKYYFTFSSGTVSNVFGVNYSGIQDKDYWNWRRKQSGDYSSSHYSGNDYSVI